MAEVEKKTEPAAADAPGPRNEPLAQIKSRRDGVLQSMVESIPYLQFLGIRFDRRGDELTAVMPFDPKLIGNPLLPALHGGATAAFLETAAIVELAWSLLWDEMESAPRAADAAIGDRLHRLPKTIDLTVDYLRSGLPRDAYARARVVRSGRRYASVQVEAWQDNRAKLLAQATGHFLLPQRRD
ncbi:PaaI family thioesterase [Paracoccus suum]|uniref:PaaI family thioesterase n=1 Tax=Paracoccus suum TaxID=2259340 RepID=A0A344PH16_9RHOB|nr:PaaI family thioesterase [Paracoccus suum]AXC48671.1 PaaI family thioesterase [Paracoccus suum]